MKKISFYIIFLFFGTLALFIVASAGADFKEKDIEYFNDRTDYDIYFHSGENQTSILEHVEIVRFEEIAGKVFLVVRSAGFDLKDREGFILFDSISAILPDTNFRVDHKARKGRY